MGDMSYKCKLLKNKLPKSEVQYYEKMNRGWFVKTTDCLYVEFEDGTSTTYIIFEGRFTKEYMCRDCGSYYEINLGTQLIKIPKETV